MPKRLEKSIVKGILEMLNSIPRCVAFKRQAGPGRRGQPDITGCYWGMRIEIEAKALGGTVSKLQKEKLLFWKKAGAITGVAYNECDAWDIIRYILTPDDKEICRKFLQKKKQIC